METRGRFFAGANFFLGGTYCALSSCAGRIGKTDAEGSTATKDEEEEGCSEADGTTMRAEEEVEGIEVDTEEHVEQEGKGDLGEDAEGWSH